MEEKKQIKEYITNQLGQKRIDMKKVNNFNFKKVFICLLCAYVIAVFAIALEMVRRPSRKHRKHKSRAAVIFRRK